MTKYIEDLTNNIIRKNSYDKHPIDPRFVDDVARDLEILDVSNMNFETLGKILGSLETGDVLASKQELLNTLSFTGNCGDTLRQLVARALAYVIRERLKPHSASDTIVPFRRSPFHIEDSGFKSVIDGLAAKRNGSQPPSTQPKFTFVGYRKHGFDEFRAVFRSTAGEFTNSKHECEQRASHCTISREVLANWPKK
jgi:hypothetical protein